MGNLQQYIDGFKAAAVVDKMMVIAIALVLVFMVIVMIQLGSIASIGRKIHRAIKKATKVVKKKGKKIVVEQNSNVSAPVGPSKFEGYIKAVKPEQPIIVNVTAPVAEKTAEEIAIEAKKKLGSIWTGYDDEEPVAQAPVAPVVVPAPVAEPVVEEAVVEEPVAEPVVEEAVVEEPVAEPVVEEAVVEEPVAEPVVEEAVVEEPVAEPVVEEVVVEEPVAEPVVEEVVEETVATEEPADEDADEAQPEGNFVEIERLLIPKKTHEEKYAELDEDSKKYYDAIMAYAESKADVKRQASVNADTVFYGRTCIVKTQIKQTKVVCNFSMLDAGMKRALKKDKGVGVKAKFTSIRVIDASSLELAKQSVDFAYNAALEEKEFKHQQQLQKRRDARKAKKDAEGEVAPTDAE